MTRKTFQITFANQKSKYVSRVERDRLLLGEEIEFIKGNEYKYVGKTHTAHGLAQLGVLYKQMVRGERQEPDYYAGTFVFELREKRRREGMQSAEALAIALPQIVAKLNETLPVAGFEAAA